MGDKVIEDAGKNQSLINWPTVDLDYKSENMEGCPCSGLATYDKVDDKPYEAPPQLLYLSGFGEVYIIYRCSLMGFTDKSVYYQSIISFYITKIVGTTWFCQSRGNRSNQTKRTWQGQLN